MSNSIAELDGGAETPAPESTWTVRDFFLVWSSGLIGSLLFGLGGLLLISEDWSLILTLASGLVIQLAVVGFLSRRRPESDLRMILEFKDIPYLIVGAGIQVALVILLAPLAEALLPEVGPVQDTAGALVNSEVAWVRSTIALLVVFVGPPVEELAYRGVLFNALLHRGETSVTLITAAVFSAVHAVTLTPPYAISAVLVLPPIFILGIVLARLRLRTGRLGPSIMTHTGFNAITAAVLLLPPEVLERLSG